MREVRIRRNSWHYKLANSFGGDAAYATDICAYVRLAIVAALLYVFCIAAVIVFSAPLGDFFGWLIAGFKHGFVEPEGLAIVAIAMLIICGALTIMALIINNWDRISSDTFVGDAYYSLRNKVCFKVRIE